VEIVGNFCAPRIENQPIVSILLRTREEQSVLMAVFWLSPKRLMLSKSLTEIGCRCSSTGGLLGVVLAILEMELDVGMILERDEIENEGEWGLGVRGKVFILSRSWED
jgi:hypothetical protein